MTIVPEPIVNHALQTSIPGRTFRDGDLLQIGMPMGGIGAGCICLSGYGGLQDFSIRHKPATTALADGWFTTEAAFAVLRVNVPTSKSAAPITRLVEGPLPVEKVYDQALQAQGFRKGGFEGFPRFEHCAFTAAYPFGEVALSDPAIPLKVRITGWSPFIPLDDTNSGIPCAILEYELKNTSDAAAEFEFSYHLSHIARGKEMKKTRNAVIPGEVSKNNAGVGVSLYTTEPANSEDFGSASLSVVGHQPLIKAMWMRGGWFDWVNALWTELSAGTFRPNNGNTSRDLDGPNGGSLLLRGRLEPGQTITCPVVITWYFPNSNLTVGALPAAGDAKKAEDAPPLWHPYYVSQWNDAADVAAYVRKNFATLRSRTLAFQQALFSSTLPPEAIDAIASNLAILKSPTVLRQENGSVWAWEGCFTDKGSCHGTCTHVWNYAQALPHLFPKLERTLREAEYDRSMDESGHVNFRSALPDGPTTHDFHPAADGQLGGIMKVYRDWQISGDSQWLKRIYPLAIRSLNYCIEKWDPEHRGALFEPHHNTYDIEFWGPDAMCTSIYIGALLAAAAMAEALGKSDDVARYHQLAEKGKAFADVELFNGEYFQQKVMWKELKDPSFANQLLRKDVDEEEMRVLREEGPKYQYGSGCLSDGVIGAWMARIYSIGDVLPRNKVRATLAAIFKHNFKPSLWAHACTQRPGYAIGHEPGLILCTWPRGGRPTLPFVYSDEVWTGIEYQVASHLIEEDMVEEAMTIVRGVRKRYDGRARNPFNEYECGSYYARALASFALLNSLSGFRYSAATQTLHFGPKLERDEWQSFFSTASAFGTIHLRDATLRVEVIEGTLPIKKLIVTIGGKAREVRASVIATPGEPAEFDLS